MTYIAFPLRVVYAAHFFQSEAQACFCMLCKIKLSRESEHHIYLYLSIYIFNLHEKGRIELQTLAFLFTRQRK